MPRINSNLNKSFGGRKKNRIIRNDLVIHYDPGNSRSYSGLGTALYNIENIEVTSLIRRVTHNAARSYFAFKGDSDISIPAKWNNFDFSQGITVSIWYNHPYSNSTYILITNGGFVIGSSYDIDTSTLKIKVIINILRNNKKVNHIAEYSFTQVNPQFNHIVFTYNNSTLNLYINGGLVLMSAQIYSPGTFTKRKNYPITLGYDELLIGKVGPLRIYNKALSDDIVSRIYTNESAPYIGSGEVLPIISSGLVFDADNDLLTDSVTGAIGSKYGTATYSSSDGGYVHFINHSDPAPIDYTNLIRYDSSILSGLVSAMTISAWVYFFSNNIAVIVDKLSNGTVSTLSQGFMFYRKPNVFYLQYGNNNRTKSSEFSASGKIETNRWYLVSVTLNGRTAKLYINGEEMQILDHDRQTNNPSLVNSLPMNIGRSKNTTLKYTSNSKGPGRDLRIGKLYIYNRDLSENEQWENFIAERARYGV